MPKVRFGDVVKEVKNNIDRNHNPYEYYVAGDHMDTADLTIHRRGCFATDDVGPAFVREFKKGQILYGSRRTYLKKVAVANFDGVTANTTFVLETKDAQAFDQRLLPFIMLTESFTDWSVKHSKGSTNPYILFSDLANYEFELPDIEKQHQLSDLMWAFFRLREKYENLLQKSDQLVQSQFVEMFGDPVTNPNGWLKLTVRDAVEQGYIARPLDGNHGEKHPKNSDYVSHGVPFLMAQDLRDKHVDFSQCHFITEKQAKTLTKGWAKTGDVLLTNKGTIGRVAIIQPSDYQDMLLTPQITYYRCLKEIDNQYLAAFFGTGFFINQLSQLTTGTTRASVTITQQEKLELIIPPREMQMAFVALVNQLDKSKLAAKQALESLDAMQKSLMRKHLTGE